MGASIIPIALGISALTGAGGAIASGLSSKSTMPEMTPTGQALNSANSSFLENILTDPQAGMGPIASAGTQSIDNGYAGSASTISRMMASRGYGSSGEMGDTMYQTDLSRLGSLSQFQGSMAQLESQRQMQASGDINQQLGINTGSNVSTPGAGLANGLLSATGSTNSSLGILAMMSGVYGGGGYNGNLGGVGGYNGNLGGVGGNGQTPLPGGPPVLINSSPGGGTTEDLGW